MSLSKYRVWWNFEMVSLKSCIVTLINGWKFSIKLCQHVDGKVCGMWKVVVVQMDSCIRQVYWSLNTYKKCIYTSCKYITATLMIWTQFRLVKHHYLHSFSGGSGGKAVVVFGVCELCARTGPPFFEVGGPPLKFTRYFRR